MEQNVLRPRTASQSPLLPRHAPPTLAISRHYWRLWLLLLSGALYVALLVCWNASRLELLDASRANVGESKISTPEHLVVASKPPSTSPPEAPVEQLSAREVSIRAALAVARAQEVEMKAKMTLADKKEKKKVDARLRCRGWKATSDCDPDGARLPDLDLPCGKPVPVDQSEYCELEDKDTGEVSHVVKRTCNSVREDAKFRCLDAAEFVKFPIRANEVAKKASMPAMTPAPTQKETESDGYPDEVIWTHLLSFNRSAPRTDYVIEAYSVDPHFQDQHCYGQRHIGSNPSFYAQEIANLSFAGLETDLRRFAMEAADQATQNART
ncbi:hypothetical protein PC113_g10718 [Phytophthora cactorum]|uniref:Uncharacterized protein n=1 Tax=Phytophthora cactorum TaxID=29920 RepID=A0A8T0Z505_9STRA|nr:hypothetical protein PC113_g10718 [Phytophthora cactorum]